MRNPYPRPRRVPPRGTFTTLDVSTPRPSEPPKTSVPVPAPEPVYRFELERAPEDRYNGTKYWAERIVVAVNAVNQTEAVDKAKKLSGNPPNNRYLYTFRTKSVTEV